MTVVAKIHYEDAARSRVLMRPGDLLLYRDDQDVQDLLIAHAGRSLYCHAALLDRVAGEWRILEMTQWHGGRDTPLADSVARYPGHWDVFNADRLRRWPEYDSAIARAKMREFVDRDYGWLHVAQVAFMRLPMAGLLFPARLDDDERGDDHPPFCSEAVSIAYRAAGVDPVPNLAHRYTEPGDLARSLFFQYSLTLIP